VAAIVEHDTQHVGLLRDLAFALVQLAHFGLFRARYDQGAVDVFQKRACVIGAEHGRQIKDVESGTGLGVTDSATFPRKQTICSCGLISPVSNPLIPRLGL